MFKKHRCVYFDVIIIIRCNIKFMVMENKLHLTHTGSSNRHQKSEVHELLFSHVLYIKFTMWESTIPLTPFL